MPTDTRVIKERLTARGNITPEQPEDIVDALFSGDDPVVTKSVLRNELNRATLRIVVVQSAIIAVMLALFAFAS